MIYVAIVTLIHRNGIDYGSETNAIQEYLAKP